VLCEPFTEKGAYGFVGGDGFGVEYAMLNFKIDGQSDQPDVVADSPLRQEMRISVGEPHACQRASGV
jgi:hypothetical protein